MAPGYALRGWKLLPYAVQSLFYPKTEFFTEDDWALFSACDGQTDVDWDTLSEQQRGRYEHWEKGGFIRRAGDGERLRPE